MSCATHPLAVRVESLIDEYQNKESPGGAILALRDGKIAYGRAFGLADVEESIPITPATNFRLASVTKQFTAMAVMIQQERGSLSFDDTLLKFFPEFPPMPGSVTVHQLLTHTSGILSYESLMPDTTTIPILDRGVAELLRNHDSTYFPPGSTFRYSNSGYALLALIVEQTSGLTFARFLHENIFQPLGMRETVAFEEGISFVKHRAFGYTPDTVDGFRRTDQSLTSSVLGDGGIYSSVEDLIRWDGELTDPTLVAQESLDEAFRRHVRTDRGNDDYGYGWFIRDQGGQTAVYHGGSTVGFRTCIVRIPGQKTTVIVLMNRSDAKTEPLAFRIADLVAGLP